ncbi:hypothetical protein HHI36_001525 [Cryptolaemus montrouzieri]|uniref:Uncharacterized protein n=1 Tax=Cryptolaemus montrouzieri TaxID=559131 RepID=A0ABD2P7Y1_9CUCU
MAPFCKKCVSELILAIPADSYADVLATFNSHHDTLKFTLEKLSYNSDPFLDTLIITVNQRLINDWY